MTILAIETSADETAVAVTSERRVLSNVINSQIALHNKWGGIYPALAKRAHEERIDSLIESAIKKFDIRYSILEIMKRIDYIAVTQGPGLAIALEVGSRKAKELAQKYNKKIIPVNHLEGHIYSSFVQNSQGNPKKDFKFPYLAMIISGGHTEFVLWKDHLDFEVIGETLDDAAGEALDKAAKMLGLGYPGGPILERLAGEVDNTDLIPFPRPMLKSDNLDFSFSGLKTSLFYYLYGHSGKRSASRIDSGVVAKAPPQNDIVKNIRQIASSFQEAVFDTILFKTEKAIKKTGVNRLCVGGGVSANLYLRKKLRSLAKKYKGEVNFPTYKYLTGDNAAMIGVAAFYKAEKGMFAKDLSFDRIPRMRLGS